MLGVVALTYMITTDPPLIRRVDYGIARLGTVCMFLQRSGVRYLHYLSVQMHGLSQQVVETDGCMYMILKYGRSSSSWVYINAVFYRPKSVVGHGTAGANVLPFSKSVGNKSAR